MCIGACAIRPHSIAPVYLLEIHSLQFLNWHLTTFDSMEMNNNKLYVLYFVTILHSDTSMFVYIKTDELITTIVRISKFYFPEILQL